MAETDLESGAKVSNNESREDFLSDLDNEEVQTAPKIPSPSGQVDQALENIDKAMQTEDNLELNLDEPEPKKEELGVHWTIDERFKDLPKAEGALRTLKSQHDRLETTNLKLAQDAEESSKIDEFFDNIMSDDEYLEAFLHERKPELIRKVDRTAIIKDTLSNEFPEYVEEKPSREESDNDPFGRAAEYYRRIDELWLETKGNGKKVSTSLKDWKVKHDADKQALQDTANEEVRLAQEKLGYTDEQMRIGLDWGKKLGVYEVLRLHRAVVKKPTSSPSTTHSQGAPVGKTERQRFLDDLG